MQTYLIGLVHEGEGEFRAFHSEAEGERNLQEWLLELGCQGDTLDALVEDAECEEGYDVFCRWIDVE